MKNTFKNLICSCFILLPVTLSAQEIEYSIKDHFAKLSDSVNCIMIGEEHGRRNISNQTEIIRTVYELKGVKHVFLELPKTCQLEVDLYLTGKIKDPTSMHRYSRNTYICKMLAGIKKAFSEEIKSGKISFHCFDVEYDEKVVERFSSSIQHIKDPRLNDLRFMLIYSPGKISENIKKGKKILEKLENDSLLYQEIFGNYYRSLYEGLKENIRFLGVEDFVFSFDGSELRERAMDSTIRSCIDLKKDKIIILTGMDHTENIREAYFYNDPRIMYSLYNRLENADNSHIIRYNFLYMPNHFPRGLIFHTIEKDLDRKKWMKLLKKRKYLICASSQITEDDYSDIGNYFIMNNIRYY